MLTKTNVLAPSHDTINSQRLSTLSS